LGEGKIKINFLSYIYLFAVGQNNFHVAAAYTNGNKSKIVLKSLCLGHKIQDTTASTLEVVEYLCTCRTFLIDINFTEFSSTKLLIFILKVGFGNTDYQH
jgi:hypothetical protein